jgi:hypothetical protein
MNSSKASESVLSEFQPGVKVTKLFILITCNAEKNERNIEAYKGIVHSLIYFVLQGRV